MNNESPFQYSLLYKMFHFLTSPFLFILSLIIQSILTLRHFLYDHQILKSHSFSNVFIIGIGNLNFGGSGKSPLTNYLIELLKPHYKIAVLSRGYGRKTKGFRWIQPNDIFYESGDEPLMYKHQHPHIPIAVCENRVTGIKNILQQFPDTQIILLDDAFQHRKIKAHLNIVLTEFSKPFFSDAVFPLGTLRDIKKSISRADVVIVSKTPENASQQHIHQTEIYIKKYTSKDICFSTIEYQNLYALHNTSHTISVHQQLSQYNCILITGIANPKPLFTYIKEYARYVYPLIYPDHHNFSEKDMDIIITLWKKWQKEHPPSIIITTEKDAVRLKYFISPDSNMPIFVAPIQMNFQAFSPTFNHKILNYVATYSANHSIHS